ncbi:MAG: hypothetical protein Q9159_004336 [Coniocarpon cinnabarinum]
MRVALFRALLCKCHLCRLDEDAKRTSLNVIRNSFKRNRHSASKVELNKAFRAGYEEQALRLLTLSSQGDASSTNRLTNLLSTTPLHLTKSPRPSPLLRWKPKFNSAPLNPDSSAILSRPRPVVPGPRHIPILVYANNYPMLRFKKPQPHRLGVYIKRKVQRRQKRQELRDELAEAERFGIWEDEWDRTIRAKAAEMELEVEGPDEEKQSWTWFYRFGLWHLGYKLRVDWENSAELVGKMERVVEKERALKQEEGRRQRQVLDASEWRAQQEKVEGDDEEF